VTVPSAARSALRNPSPDTAADLRMPALGAAAWAGALLGSGLHDLRLLVLVGILVLFAAALRRARSTAALLVTVAALAGAAGLRAEANAGSPVAQWAEQRAVVNAVLVVTSDPVARRGRFGDYVVAEAATRSVTARGRHTDAVVPLLVIGGPDWADVELGAEVQVTGRLGPADSAEHAGVLSGGDGPVVLARPSPAYRAADAVRSSVREAAASGPGHTAQLVPALVTGDDEALAVEVVDDFRTAGLTHLTAVSGTNLTLVLVFVLLLARWAGVTGRGLLVVGLLGVVGFVLMARPEPSVVRAAAMGTVALLGLGAGGRAAGVRALGAAVLLLLVYDPWLARSPGFALSVLATGGILVVAPGLRDAMARWLPQWAAEAVAVPLAAQLACTPVVAALSGEVSLVAVAANLVAAPMVAPATVLGLVGGLVGLVAPPVGSVVGTVAGWSAQLIVVTAQRAADLPSASVGWPGGATGILVLSAVTVLATAMAPAVLRRRWAATTVALLLAVVVVRPLPTPGWPPTGWVLVMCDVGQGDALAVAAGAGQAVVVDAGPDDEAVEGCLDRLRVRQVPAVVLTHFHADHVDGLPGVLRGRDVGEVQVSGLREPSAGAAQVSRWAEAAGVPLRVPAYGEEAAVGDVRWWVVGPRRLVPGSPNDSSLVLLVDVRGVRILLTGDVEPLAQATLAGVGLGAVDVLKVPHHGSGHQDEGLLTGVLPRVALVSVGEGNDYGHPDPGVMALLEGAGAVVRRTDESGDVAVVERDGRLQVVSRG
jgi:competence protein ComEC